LRAASCDSYVDTSTLISNIKRLYALVEFTAITVEKLHEILTDPDCPNVLFVPTKFRFTSLALVVPEVTFINAAQ